MRLDWLSQAQDPSQDERAHTTGADGETGDGELLDAYSRAVTRAAAHFVGRVHHCDS